VRPNAQLIVFPHTSIYDMNAALDSHGSHFSSDQSRSKARPDRQSESLALDNARTVFMLVSNLGSGSLNVPGLQAAGQLGIQIIDIIRS